MILYTYICTYVYSCRLGSWRSWSLSWGTTRAWGSTTTSRLCYFSMAYTFLYMFLIPVLEKLKIFCRYISHTNQNTHRINQNCMVKCKAEYLKYWRWKDPKKNEYRYKINMPEKTQLKPPVVYIHVHIPNSSHVARTFRNSVADPDHFARSWAGSEPALGGLA